MNICLEIETIIKEVLPDVLCLRDKKQLKEDDSFVSHGDILLQTKIAEYIKLLGPEFYLISEEKNNSDFSFEKYRWAIVLDPIDGTENFISGLKEWGVGVSVYYDNKHLQSMIAIPELDIFVKTGDSIRKYQSRIIGLSSSLKKSDILALDRSYEYRIIGCAMYNMYNVVSGSYAVFRNTKGAHTWDILPGLNLALEHNCNVTLNNKKYNGEFLYPNQKYCFQIQNQ